MTTILEGECEGFGDCERCVYTVTVTLCRIHDRIKYKCRRCKRRTSTAVDDPRFLRRLCTTCFREGPKV